MDWDGFRIFLAIARSGRVSAAARQLGVDHTTVGRRLAALEAEIGARLFYRTAGGYRLSPEGEAVLAGAEAMERAAVVLPARAREGSGRLTGRVRIALIAEFASHWLAARLPEFRALLPGIDLQILADARQLDLSRGEAELAVRTPRPHQPGLVAARLGRTRTGLYASRPFLDGRQLRITDAASARGLPFLVYTPEHRALQSAAWFAPVMAAAEIVLASNSTHALLAAAEASVGIAVLPRMVARGSASLVAVSDDVAVHDIWLATHPDFRRDPAVRATADFLTRVAKGPSGLV